MVFVNYIVVVMNNVAEEVYVTIVVPENVIVVNMVNKKKNR